MLNILIIAWSLIVHTCLASPTPPGDPRVCNFGITAHGGVNHNISLLDNGQARGATNANKMTFTSHYFKKGVTTLVDDRGRSCGWSRKFTHPPCVRGDWTRC